MEETRNMLDGAKQDPSINLDEFLVKKNESVVEEKSPLEKMKEYKESHPGAIVRNEDVTYDNQKVDLKSGMDNEAREKDFKTYMNDMDDLIETAQSMQVKRTPQNRIEEAAMIDELDRIARQKNNKLPENPKFADGTVGNLDDQNKYGTEMVSGSTFFSEKSDSSPENEADEGDAPVADAKESEEDEEHKKLVQILIDKTGFGASNIEFTPEEKEKMRLSTEIRLTEVKTLDLDVADFVAPDSKFVSEANPASQEIGTCVVPLVASGYRVRMKGMSYGQLSDLFLNTEMPMFEQSNKKYSIVYNNIVDTTIGKFSSYEDFLKNTAVADIDAMIYGMMVPTYPEVDEVELRCRSCGKSATQKYFTRDLLDLQNSSTEYLKVLDALMAAPADEFDKIHKESPVMNHKMIQLPGSKILVEIGAISAYEHLYRIAPDVDVEKYRKEHPEDTTGALYLSTALSGVVQSYNIPREDGKYTRYTAFNDLLDISYRLPMNDYQILLAYVQAYGAKYSPIFSIKNVTCPHCHTTSKYSEVQIADLVFTRYQQLMSTEVSSESMLAI